MTVGELREKYREVFGEETRSGNKDWQWKRIAWRIQEMEYGGLSERAKRRAGDLANELDIRSRVPLGAFENAPGKKRKIVRVSATALVSHDRRLPMPGTVINREYKGNIYQVKVLDEGFEYEDRIFKSLPDSPGNSDSVKAWFFPGTLSPSSAYFVKTICFITCYGGVPSWGSAFPEPGIFCISTSKSHI